MNTHKIIKIFWIITGIISFGIGTVGVVVPLLPSFPFYLLTLIAFARGSDRLHKWFISTKLYKNNMESLINKKGMTVKTKIRVLAMITLILGFGFVMMKNVPVGRIIVAIVWVGHLLLFTFKIKTLRENEQIKDELEDSVN